MSSKPITNEDDDDYFDNDYQIGVADNFEDSDLYSDDDKFVNGYDFWMREWDNRLFNTNNKQKKRNNRLTNKLFESNYYLNDNDAFAKILLDKYREKNEISEGVQLQLFISPTKPLFGFINEIKTFFSETAEVRFELPSLVEIFDKEVYLSLNTGDMSTNDTFVLAKNYSIDIILFGKLERIGKIYKRLRKKYYTNVPTVSWLFRDSDGSMQSSEFTLKTPGKTYSEFYPFIENVDTYAQRFMNSGANVLLLLGPPGTGKTSFIRNMLISLNESALTTYDDDIMRSDRLYIKFLNSGRKFIVLEDADILLTDREREHNTVMNKILNASDGLISVSDKKFIFTANILDEDRIDSALIRPGRCFDVLKFRQLTHAEATKAANKIGNELPHDGDISLAEIFNKKQGVTKRKFKVGF